MTKRLVFRSARVFDGESDVLLDRADVVVVGETIEEVSAVPVAVDADTEVIECGGRVLMPGMLDAHVHVYASSVNLAHTVQSGMSYLAHFASRFLQNSLDHGFTTVRDVGGADAGLAAAIRDRLLTGVPRLLYGGRFLSQTGGHGDFRAGDKVHEEVVCCGCSFHCDTFGVVVDGVDAVRKAVREELRRGASHVKIMASGGVASPTDPLDRCQYSDGEILAAVDEADRAGSYIAAHCHPTEAVYRAAKLGIRSIEHATLIDAKTADFVAERGSYTVPTMSTVFALYEKGEELGLPPVSIGKLRRVIDSALVSLEIMKRAGVKMGLGTDLLGELYKRQCTEFTLRGQVLPAIDILRSACSINAELMQQKGKLGCIRKGAAADLLVVDGNPLEDISLLANDGKSLAVILHDGKFHKRTI